MADATHDDVPRWLSRAFVALCVEVYGLLVFGAAVRVHEAGLSCPDWPLCFGEVIPEMDLQIFLEWGHRALAGTVSVVFLGLGVATARHPALRARAGRWFLAAGGVLAMQIVLGGLTVLHLLAGWSVTLHLLCGNLFLALLVAGTLALRGPIGAARPDRAMRRAVMAVACLLALQLALGGLVSSHHAGTVCTEWPACQGGLWFPSWEGPLGLHLLHRMGAYTLFAAAWGLAWAGGRRPALRGPALALAGLVTVQALLGIGNVLWSLPQTLAIGHSAMAGLLTLTMTWVAARAWRLEAAPVPARADGGVPVPHDALEGT